MTEPLDADGVPGGGQASLASSLARLREEAQRSQDSWRHETGGGPPESAELRLHMTSDQATLVALTLYDVDREIRRAAQVVRQEYAVRSSRAKTFAQAFSPLPLSQGGLVIRDVVTRSPPDFVLVASGAVAQFLLSSPVQLILTAKELLSWGGAVLIRVKRRGGLERTVISSSGAIDFKASADGVQLGEVPEGTRIRLIHRLADGTETLMDIERD